MKKLIAILVCLLFVPMVFGDETYDTAAQILSTGGNAPEIEYAWVLPDEDSASETQLIPAAEAERTDIYACIVVSDLEGRDDIQDVWLDLYHPANDYTVEDATKKYQVHATMLTDPAEIEACKDAALSADLIIQDDHDLIDYWIFDQPGWYMYKVYLPMLYHQPAGNYLAEVKATDTIGNVGVRSYDTFFQWVPTVILATDIGSSLDFGTLQKGIAKYVQGDTDFGTGGPTLKNQGNVPIGLSVISTPMVGIATSKEIIDFDVQFRGDHFDYVADAMQLLPKALRNCHTEKIDFSVHPAGDLPIDDYEGDLTLGAYDGSAIPEPEPAVITTAQP